jgi:hypothetical protein
VELTELAPQRPRPGARHLGPPAAIQCSFDGRKIYACTKRGILSFDRASGEAESRLLPDDEVGTLALSPDGRSLFATARRDGESQLVGVDLSTGAERWRLPPQRSFLGPPTASPDSSRLFAWDSRAGGRIRALDPRTGAELWSAPRSQSWSPLLASPDGTRLFASTAQGLRCYDAATGAVHWELEGEAHPNLGGGITPDGATLFWPVNEQLFAIDAATGTLRKRFGEVPRDPNNFLEVSPCGRWLLISDQQEGSCAVFNAATFEPVRTVPHRRPSFTADGALVQLPRQQAAISPDGIQVHFVGDDACLQTEELSPV